MSGKIVWLKAFALLSRQPMAKICSSTYFRLFFLRIHLLCLHCTAVQCQTCCLHFSMTQHTLCVVWCVLAMLIKKFFFFPIRSGPIHFLSFDIVTSEYKNKRFNLYIKPTKGKTRREYSQANRQRQQQQQQRGRAAKGCFKST